MECKSCHTIEAWKFKTTPNSFAASEVLNAGNGYEHSTEHNSAQLLRESTDVQVVQLL